MIAPADYEALRAILQESSGHALADGKEYLVERRLRPVAESLGHPDLAALVRHIRLTGDPHAIRCVSEAMATHESLFFRDGRPFELLRHRILPELMERRLEARHLRIWSAGCSTGQEAYSVAMLIEEMHPALAGWRVEIVGTDFAPSAIHRAQEGVYNHFEVQRGLSAARLCRHFQQTDAGWRIRDEVRRHVRFQQGNLLQPFRHLGTFDVVLCRNVLIYFDPEVKKDVLRRLAEVTAPDGYLFLGCSETALGLTDHWTVVSGANTTLFRQRPRPGSAPGKGADARASA